MAIWQFKFDLLPRDAVERFHAPDTLILSAFQPIDPATWAAGDETAEYPAYWENRSPQAYASEIGAMLPPRQSWSDDALMFGTDNADEIELWTDDFHVKLNMLKFEPSLTSAIVQLAARDDLVLVLGETGRLIVPTYDNLARQISQSRAVKFVGDPVATLEMIGRGAR